MTYRSPRRETRTADIGPGTIAESVETDNRGSQQAIGGKSSSLERVLDFQPSYH